MARGYPDYGMSPAFPFAKVFAIQSILVDSIAGGVYKEVYSITGKGQIESGYVHIDDTLLPHLIGFYLYIDGTLMKILSPYSLRYLGIYADTTWPYYLTYYDPDTPRYVVSFRKEVFFGVSFVFGILNGDPLAIDIFGEIQYAHI